MMEQKRVEISSHTTSQGPLINGAFLGCGCHPQEDVSEISHQGERYVPVVDPYSAASHLGHMASYKCALLYAFGKKVLDLGCGSGYGSHFLASFGASEVVAADPDEKCILYASRAYHHPRVHYVRLDGNRSLPFSDHSFDFVFCSQVIEHIDAPLFLLKEFRRILKPGGFCLVTTPNKDLFSPSDDKSPNQYHINEMNPSQYETLGTQAFPCIRLAGIPQNCLAIDSNNIVTLKSNEDLILEDFQVRSDNLASCENLLLFGHTLTDGKFGVSLPESQSQPARNLAPYFWDPWVKQWVMMDNYPATRKAQGLTSRSIRKANTMIYSFYNNLYRVEIGFLKDSIFDIEVTLRRGSREGPVVSREVMPIEGNKLRLVFPPVPDSARKVFYLELRVQCSLVNFWPLGVFLGRSCQPPRLEFQDGKFPVWTFNSDLGRG